jgi:hypothetical protein
MMHELAMALIVRNSTAACTVTRGHSHAARHCAPATDYRRLCRLPVTGPAETLLSPFYSNSKAGYIIG